MSALRTHPHFRSDSGGRGANETPLRRDSPLPETRKTQETKTTTLDHQELYTLFYQQALRSLVSRKKFTEKRTDDVAVEQRAKNKAEAKLRAYERVTYESATGLLQRDAFFEEVQSLREAREGRKSNAAMLFIDLNDLKLINDRPGFGHGLADELIAKIGEKIRSTMRPTDQACRYGGDEFVIFANDIGVSGDFLSKVGQMSDRVYKALSTLAIVDVAGKKEVVDCADKNIVEEDGRYFVYYADETDKTTRAEIVHKATFSMGVRPITQDELKSKTHPKEWITEADEALYMVKRSGRNDKAGFALITQPKKEEIGDNGVKKTIAGKCVILKGYKMESQSFSTQLKDQTMEQGIETEVSEVSMEMISRKLGVLLDKCGQEMPNKVSDAIKELAHVINRDCPLRN